MKLLAWFTRRREVDEEYEGATIDWSPVQEIGPSLDTGELDLSWFQSHIRMTEIEEKLSRQLNAVMNTALRILESDSVWDYSVTRRLTPAKMFKDGLRMAIRFGEPYYDM